MIINEKNQKIHRDNVEKIKIKLQLSVKFCEISPF